MPGEWDVIDNSKLPQGSIDPEIAGWNVRQAKPLEGWGEVREPWTIPNTPGFLGTVAGGVKMPARMTAREVAAAALPIAGDIGASILVGPEMAARRPILAALTRALASYAGGAAGELGAQKLRGEPLSLKGANIQGLMGAGGELGTTALIKTGKPLLEKSLEIAADVSRLDKSISRMAQRSFKAMQEKIKERTTARAFKFMEDLRVLPKDEAGMQLGKVLAGKADYETIYKPFRDAVDEIAKWNGGMVKLEDTMAHITDKFNYFRARSKTDNQAIKELTAWMGFKGDARATATMKQLLSDGYLGPGDAKYVMSNFWKKSYGKTTDAANNWKKELKEIFLSDLEKFEPGARVARDFADKTYASMQQFLRESPAAQKLLQKMNFGKSEQLYYQANAEKVSEVLFGKQTRNVSEMALRNPEEILQLRNAITMEPGGEQAWKVASFDWLSDIFNKSLGKDPNTGKLFVRPAELADRIYRSEKQVKAMLPLGEWKRLKDEADFFAQASQQYEKIDVSGNYGFGQAWSVLSPKSKKIVDKALSGILKTGKQATKIGLHLIGNEINYPQQPTADTY